MTPATRRPSVLIVEDEPLVRAIASDEFEDGGFDVVAAATGDEALGILTGGKRFDLLFTDIRMPGMADGWKVAISARQVQPGIAVIYATGYSEEPAAIVAGALLFHKPYRLSAVLSGAERLGVVSAGRA